MNPLYMVLKVIQILQLHPFLLAFGMVTEYQIIALQFLHFFQMLAVEMIVHHGSSAVRERPFLVQLPFVPNTTKTLCLTYKKGEWIRSGRLAFHGSLGLWLRLDTPSLYRLSLVVQGSHKLG